MIIACEDKKKLIVKEKVAVVLLSYNSRSYLEQFLPFVQKTEYKNYHLVIVDNASTDDTQEFLRTHYPQIDVLTIAVNRGFTNGYKAALNCVEAEYYALLSSDVEVRPEWLGEMVDVMEADPLTGICQPAILSYHQRDSFEYAGAMGGYLDHWGYPFCRGRIFDTVEKDLGQYDKTYDVFWACGASPLVRASVYHEVGGLDNDFFAHMEEIDMCWRIQKAGYKVKAVGTSKVYHVGGSVILYGSPEKTYRNYRNNLIMITKNMPAGRLLWLIPWRILLDWVSGFQALLAGRGKDMGAILKAHAHYWGRWFYWLGKRRHIDSKVSFRKLKGLYYRSIVWQYFARKRKTFDMLPLKGWRKGEHT